MTYRDAFLLCSGGMAALGVLLSVLAIPVRFGRIMGWEDSLGVSTGWHVFVLTWQVALLFCWLLLYPRLVVWTLK